MTDLSDEDLALLAKLADVLGPMGMVPRSAGRADAHCPSWPEGHAAGELGYLAVLHDAYPFGFDVTGWMRLHTQTRDGTNITAFHRFATSSCERNPEITLAGAGTWGRIFTFTRIASVHDRPVPIELRSQIPILLQDRLIACEPTWQTCGTCGATLDEVEFRHAPDCPRGIYLLREKRDETWRHMTPKQKLELIRTYRPERAP